MVPPASDRAAGDRGLVEGSTYADRRGGGAPDEDAGEAAVADQSRIGPGEAAGAWGYIVQQAKHHCSVSGIVTSEPSVSQSDGVTYIRWTG